MASFMIAWELGGGLGHLDPCCRLARALQQRGHRVELVVKDLSLTGRLLGDAVDAPGLRMWQAPVWLPSLAGLPDPVNHAELLFRAGYLDGPRLAGLARAWRSLLATSTPQVLVADHAPTALLAAHGLPLRKAVFGMAFALPPPCRPLPAFRDWEAASPQRLEAAEQRALTSCNHVLTEFGVPPLNALHELYDVDEQLLTGWPELDPHHAFRAGPGARHWGVIGEPVSGNGAPVGAGGDAWPAGAGPRIVGYLQREHPAWDTVLAHLRGGPGQSVLHLAGSSADEALALSGPRLRVEAEPLHLPSLLPGADLWIGQGGTGATHQALQAGVPAVLLPLQLEQLLQARRVVAIGAGVLLWPEEVAQGLPPAIAAVTGSPGFRQAARTLAARHPGDALPAIVARCEVLAETAEGV